MGRYFFSGGIMPSAGLAGAIRSRAASVTQSWTWNGAHYQRTAEAWLANLDARRELAPSDSELCSWRGRRAADGFNRWRMFFLAVSELFGFAGGTEWFVSHYLLEHAEDLASSELT